MLLSVLWRFFNDRRTVELFVANVIGHKFWFLCVVALMPLNWFFETLKWKNLIAVSEEISWKEAWSGVLAGLAIGAATPNRVGEFAGRIFQLKKTELHDGISCTMVCSVMQVGVTMLAGVMAMLMTNTEEIMHKSKVVVWVVVLTVVILALIVIVRNATGKWTKYLSVLKKMSGVVLMQTFLLSAFRYVVYATQFLIMLRICGIASPSSVLIGAIAINYMVVSVIPSVMISELFVRGSVASGVIGALCGSPELAAMAAILTWLLNVGLPSIAGMFFVRNLTFFKAKN